MNIYDLWLSNLEISNKNKILLLKKYKNTDIIWQNIEEIIQKENIKTRKDIKDLKQELIKENNINKQKEYIEKNNIKLIKYTDDSYPIKLKKIDDPPTFLYVKGNIENLYMQNVAIVGSRNASSYGKEIARKIGKEIADNNINIVSGLAIGIDKFAHLGALDSKLGKTIAVLGTGLLESELYPLENRKVYERILENNGTIISEYRLGVKISKYNFPYRNRIISGLSEKIIVVEASSQSGSLITVEYALDQGKDVFAIPGNINSKNSQGTNKLIQEGANIFTKTADILI